MRVIRLYKILNIHDLRTHNTTEIIFEKLRVSRRQHVDRFI